MAPNQPDMGEQALSKAAEIGMASQLDEKEELDVDLRTDAGKLMQGELESADIEGKGLVMQKDLRAEELDIHTNSISINPLKAAFGNIELERPTDASAHVVLNEHDIDHAFNSDFIRQKLQNLEVTINGEPTKVNTDQIKFRLPGGNRFAFDADVSIAKNNETKQVAFTAEPKVQSGGSRIALEDVQYTEGKEASPELTEALLNSASELLDLQNFELQGMSLRIKSLEVQQGKLVIEADAHVEQFPGQ